MSKSTKQSPSNKVQRINDYSYKIENVFTSNRKFVIDGNSLRVSNVDIKNIDGVEIWFITTHNNNFKVVPKDQNNEIKNSQGNYTSFSDQIYKNIEDDDSFIESTSSKNNMFDTRQRKPTKTVETNDETDDHLLENKDNIIEDDGYIVDDDDEPYIPTDEDILDDGCIDDEPTDDDYEIKDDIIPHQLVYLSDTKPEDFKCNDCYNTAYFCIKGGNIPTYCYEHKDKDMYHVYLGSCCVCGDVATHISTNKHRYCKEHRPDNCKMIRSNESNYPLTVSKTFMYELRELRNLNKRKKIILKGKKVNRTRVCIHQDCNFFANFGLFFPDEKHRSVFCKKHLDFYFKKYQQYSLDKIIGFIYNDRTDQNE